MPQNYGEKFHGTVTLEEAIVKSLNVPTVKLCSEVGVESVVEIGHACGIESRIPYEVWPALTPPADSTIHVLVFRVPVLTSRRFRNRSG